MAADTTKNRAQKITPNLWFDTQAEEAANFYVTLFDNSRIGEITRYDDASAEVSGQPQGSAMTVSFELAGQRFVALNG
ncbi:MAG: VOC family protein, partial [Candidatus Promineifilaceae bacterium]